MDEVQLTQADN